MKCTFVIKFRPNAPTKDGPCEGGKIGSLMTGATALSHVCRLLGKGDEFSPRTSTITDPPFIPLSIGLEKPSTLIRRWPVRHSMRHSLRHVHERQMERLMELCMPTSLTIRDRLSLTARTHWVAWQVAPVDVVSSISEAWTTSLIHQHC